MKTRRNACLTGILLVLCAVGLSSFGCATKSQIRALEDRTDNAVMKSEQALQEAQSAKGVVDKLAIDSSQVSGSADKAERAASRAERAAAAAEASARRAEQAAKRCEEIYNRIMSK